MISNGPERRQNNLAVFVYGKLNSAPVNRVATYSTERKKRSPQLGELHRQDDSKLHLFLLGALCDNSRSWQVPTVRLVLLISIQTRQYITPSHGTAGLTSYSSAKLIIFLTWKFNLRDIFKNCLCTFCRKFYKGRTPQTDNFLNRLLVGNSFLCTLAPVASPTAIYCLHNQECCQNISILTFSET